MDSFAIGRGPRNQLSLADTSVSREHCVILRQGDNFLIRDLESFHGTLVNDTRVMERMLANGDCIQLGRSLLRFLTDDDVVCQETSEDARTIEIPADQTQLPATLENSRDLHTLLRMSIMLHSFQALYKVRRSPARSTLERHLLEFIFEVIPSNRGAILLYEGDSSEPSSLSVRSEESAPHRPVVINWTLVRRVMQERCGLIVENLEAEQSAGAGSGKSAALLLVPLLIRERVFGIVYLEGTAFSEPDLQLLVAIAQIASMALENAFHLDWLKTENERLESELHPDHHMIGDSARLRELQRNILRAAQANSTVLIAGETGTGKELVARALHQDSPRAGEPFIASTACRARCGPGRITETQTCDVRLGSHTYAESKSLARFCCELLNLQHLAESAVFESARDEDGREVAAVARRARVCSGHDLRRCHARCRCDRSRHRVLPQRARAGLQDRRRDRTGPPGPVRITRRGPRGGRRRRLAHGGVRGGRRAGVRGGDCGSGCAGRAGNHLHAG